MNAVRLAIAALVVSAPAAADQQPLRLDTLVPSLMRRFDVPGAAVAIVRGDNVVALSGFGVSRLSDSVAVDPRRTLFRIASVAKLFVAYAAVQEIARGALDPRRDVNAYLAWQVPESWPEPVTLERLLTHSAGFDERLIGYATSSPDSIGDLGEHLQANLPWRGWPPGEVLGYSNYGFALAAHLVERVAGLPFDRYVRERVFEPLGMRRTHFIRVPDSLIADRADGHRCGDEGCAVVAEAFSRPYPAGLAYSTAADMAAFASALLSRDEMHTERFRPDSAVPGMSYAFFNQRFRGHRILAHSGVAPGFSSLLLVAPAESLGVFVATNGGRLAFGAALRDALLGALLPPNRATAAPEPRTAIDVGAFTGTYQLTRYAHRTVEAFPLVFFTMMRVGQDSGRPVVQFPGGAAAFEPLDSLHFAEVGGDRTIAFRRDAAGRVTHLIAPMMVFGAEAPAVFERRAWHGDSLFLNEYVSWLALGPLLVLLPGWGVVALAAFLVRRRRGVPAQPVRGYPGLVYLAAVLFQAGWLVFGFRFIARSTRMLGSSTGLVYGVTDEFRVLAALPWLLVVLLPGLIAGAIQSYRLGWWDPVRRVGFALVTVAAALTVIFLVQWNYLPLRF